MIHLTEQRFRLMFDDTKSYQTLIERGLNFSNRTNVAEKLRLTQSNFFSLELFQSLICGGESYRTGPVNFIWSRLVAARIMIPAFGHMPGVFVDHAMDVPALLEHLRGETFLNLFAPPSALAERYGNAILAIDVERNGTPFRGSGFIAQSSHDAFPKIVTCRHNIDPADGIVVQSVTTASGRTLKTGAPIFSDCYDLCILPLDDEVQSPVFRFNKVVEMFDEVFTLGYPSLPGAMPVLTGHRGEVNAVADLYISRSPAIIISNLVAPGSSGGPVLTADGRCAGMTIRWLEGEMEDGEKTRFSAALPASAIFEEMTRKH